MPALSRREVLALAGAALARGAPAPLSPPKICIFSKHLQWLNVADAAKLAMDIGFDGIDLTVRKGGHIEPSRAAEDLPGAVETIRKAGLEAPSLPPTGHVPPKCYAVLAQFSLGYSHLKEGYPRVTHPFATRPHPVLLQNAARSTCMC